MATPSVSSLNSSRESAQSGAVVEITTSVAKFDRLEDLEDHVVDYLASVTDLKVFGCTVDFLYPNTHTHRPNMGEITKEHRIYHCFP